MRRGAGTPDRASPGGRRAAGRLTLMVSAFSENRPGPMVGALGALAVLVLVADLILVFVRACDTDLPRSSNSGPGKIVFASDRKEDLDIYAINADGSGRVQLTDSRSKESFPA